MFLRIPEVKSFNLGSTPRLVSVEQFTTPFQMQSPSGDDG